MDVSDCIIHDTEYENSNGGKFSSLFALDNRIFLPHAGWFYLSISILRQMQKGRKRNKKICIHCLFSSISIEKRAAPQ